MASEGAAGFVGEQTLSPPPGTRLPQRASIALSDDGSVAYAHVHRLRGDPIEPIDGGDVVAWRRETGECTVLPRAGSDMERGGYSCIALEPRFSSALAVGTERGRVHVWAIG